MKKIVLLIAIIAGMMIGCSKPVSQEKGDLHIYTLNNKDGKFTPEMLEKALSEGGFNIGVNSDIHGGLTKLGIESGFKVYNAISIYHKTLSVNLMKKYNNSGIFVPMGVAVYQTINEDTIHISVVSADTQAKILGENSAILKQIEAEVTKVITTLVPNATHSYNKESLKEARPLLTTYELDLKGANWGDAKDELEESFEEKFAEAGFVMPSYFDFTSEFGEDSPYDFYTTYSICKIDVIKSVSKISPEAAAFAPCTTMVYKKKDEDKIVMGFTAVYNWLSSANITEKESVDALMKAQSDFEAVLKAVTNN